MVVNVLLVLFNQFFFLAVYLLERFCLLLFLIYGIYLYLRACVVIFCAGVCHRRSLSLHTNYYYITSNIVVISM
jgi:hypothetical protein